MLSGIPSVLYHYTSADGLIGIVRNQRLWATDIEYLNDSEELTHVAAELTERIDSKITSLGAQTQDDRVNPRISQILVLLFCSPAATLLRSSFAFSFDSALLRPR